jgi:hypothetical protein
MNPKKTLCPAVLLASVLAVSSLAPAQAAPWRATGILPSVEKIDLVSWLPVALQSLWAMVSGDEGCSIDPDGGCVSAPEWEHPDHGVSIDPNGGN